MKYKLIIIILVAIIYASLVFLNPKITLISKIYGFCFTLIAVYWLYSIFSLERLMVKKGIIKKFKLFSYKNGFILWREIFISSIKKDKLYKKYLIKARIMTIVAVLMLIVTIILSIKFNLFNSV